MGYDATITIVEPRESAAVAASATGTRRGGLAAQRMNIRNGSKIRAEVRARHFGIVTVINGRTMASLKLSSICWFNMKYGMHILKGSYAYRHRTYVHVW